MKSALSKQSTILQTLKKDKIIEDTSTVIVKGYGKFKLAGKIGNTGKTIEKTGKKSEGNRKYKEKQALCKL